MTRRINPVGATLVVLLAAACGTTQDVPAAPDARHDTGPVAGEPAADAAAGHDGGGGVLDVVAAADTPTPRNDGSELVGSDAGEPQEAGARQPVRFRETCEKPWCLTRHECPSVQVAASGGAAGESSRVELGGVTVSREQVFREDGVVEEVVRFTGPGSGTAVLRRRMYGPPLAWDSGIDTAVYTTGPSGERFEAWRGRVLVYASTVARSSDGRIEARLAYPQGSGDLKDERDDGPGTPKGTLVLRDATACRELASAADARECHYPVHFAAEWGSMKIARVGAGNQMKAGAGGSGDHWWWRVCSASVSEGGDRSVALEGGLWVY